MGATALGSRTLSLEPRVHRLVLGRAGPPERIHGNGGYRGKDSERDRLERECECECECADGAGDM